MSITDEFVLDNSVTMSWAFPDEADPYARGVLSALPGASAVVPSIWPLEAANVLLVGERRGRITRADSTSFVAILDGVKFPGKCHLLGPDICHPARTSLATASLSRNRSVK